jgi:hypothetical protein
MILTAYPDHAPFRHGMRRIQHNILNHLADLALIDISIFLLMELDRYNFICDLYTVIPGFEVSDDQ